MLTLTSVLDSAEAVTSEIVRGLRRACGVERAAPAVRLERRQQADLQNQTRSFERCEWLNDLVGALWSGMYRTLSNRALRSAQEELAEQEEGIKKVPYISSIKLTSLDFGPSPPRLLAVKSIQPHPGGACTYAVDVHFKYTGSSSSSLVVTAGGIDFNGTVRDLSIEGMARLSLQPLDRPPFVKAMEISLGA